jgi:hypothetical protein
LLFTSQDQTTKQNTRQHKTTEHNTTQRKKIQQKTPPNNTKDERKTETEMGCIFWTEDPKIGF